MALSRTRSRKRRKSRKAAQPATTSRAAAAGVPLIHFETKYTCHDYQDSRYLNNLLGVDDDGDIIPDLWKAQPDDDNDDGSDLEDDSNLDEDEGRPKSVYESYSSNEESDDDDISWQYTEKDDSSVFPHLFHEDHTKPQYSSAQLKEAADDVNNLLLLKSNIEHFRNERYDHERLDWDSHVAQLLHEDTFVNEYTMSLAAHQKLSRILEPYLFRDERWSRCSEPIREEHIVAVGLRVLAGGRTKDQRHIVGSSISAAYVAFDDFVDAVNEAPELEIKLPSTVAEWERINAGFTSKSSHGIIGGAVCAIDGFFQQTNKPASTEVTNNIAYYSGHYESYGVNSLACVQSDLQFLYFGVLSPGSTNDNITYAKAVHLRKAIEELPLGLYAVADAAFTQSEHILIPFTGIERYDPVKDAFNFFLSQLRIRVEMAFGRLVNKFRILSGKIEGSLDRVTAVLTACARLHNYIIQEDGPREKVYESVEKEMESQEIQPNPLAPLGMSYLPVVPDETFEEYPGVSYTRRGIVDYLRRKEIGRPTWSIERKKREQMVVISPNDTVNDREFISPI